MLLYESNYLKLVGLTGDLEQQASRWISRVRGDGDLHLERVLAEPYTTTYRMTYWLRDANGVELRDPDLTVRVYRDAAQAEALACLSWQSSRAMREIKLSHSAELSRRWSRNIMLNKWLDYLLERGHGFS